MVKLSLNQKTDLDEFKILFSRRLLTVVEARGYPKNNFGRNTTLANELGISAPYVYKLFHGQIGSPYTLKLLAIHLRTTTDYLLGLSDVMDRPETESPTPTKVEEGDL